MVFSRGHHGKTPVIITKTIEPFENQLKFRGLIGMMIAAYVRNRDMMLVINNEKHF